jgi:hypothetical protein
VRSIRKVLLLLVGAAVLWVPAVSVAGDSSPNPSKLTAKEKARDAKGAGRSPAGICKSIRFHGTYGGRGGGANAFGKCVSTTAKPKDKSEGGAKSHGEESSKSHGGSANPAMICKAMRAKTLAHFQTTYGMRPNAFGKCVARHASSSAQRDSGD